MGHKYSYTEVSYKSTRFLEVRPVWCQDVTVADKKHYLTGRSWAARLCVAMIVLASMALIWSVALIASGIELAFLITMMSFALLTCGVGGLVASDAS